MWKEQGYMSETATNNSVQGEEIQKVNLVKISARINQKIDDVMREMAKEYGVSFSEVVRLAIDGHLEQYFGNVQYMDAEQGREIRMRCALLGTEMQHIRNELNKIGVNVNQIAKWNNIEAEIVQLKQSMAGKTAKERYEIVERVQFLQKCQNEILLRWFSHLIWKNMCNDMREPPRGYRKHYGIYKGNQNCKW